MSRLEGKVAFVTGGARGQGRSHAVRLAAEGADIILVDICSNIPTNRYDLATPDDLAETVRLVEEHDRRAIAAQADVRDYARLKEVLAGAVAELGRLDIVLANAGIAPMSEDEDDEIAGAVFQTVIDVNLVGVWNTCRVSIPHLIAGGRGGAMVLTSSTAGIRGIASGSSGSIGYSAAKHGVVGIMRSLANALAPESIRVNTIHPTGVNTPDGRQPRHAGLAREQARPQFGHDATRCRSSCSKPRTSATPLPSWCPTKRSTSPGSCCRWMRASAISNASRRLRGPGPDGRRVAPLWRHPSSSTLSLRRDLSRDPDRQLPGTHSGVRP